MGWLVSHSERMEPIDDSQWKLVHQSRGSGLSMAQSLFLRPDKIETIHSDSTETSLTSLLLSYTESIQSLSLVSPAEDKLHGIQQELSPKLNRVSIVYDSAFSKKM